MTYPIDESGVTNVYTVRCVSGDGSKYMSGYVKAGFSHTYIATPRLRSVKNRSDGIRFVFYQVEGAPKYRIYRKTAGTSWKKIADVSNKKDYYLDKTAKSGVEYTYTVRCILSNGKKHVSSYDKNGLTIVRE